MTGRKASNIEVISITGYSERRLRYPGNERSWAVIRAQGAYAARGEQILSSFGEAQGCTVTACTVEERIVTALCSLARVIQ